METNIDSHNFWKFFFFTEIKCVRLLKIIIPAYRFRNENAMLECDFELDKVKNDETYADEDLYSVKWYKDNEEFYRYVPRANPPQNSYKVDGIKVDVSVLIYCFFISGKKEIRTWARLKHMAWVMTSFEPSIYTNSKALLPLYY
jgi:hypothetical protein